MRVHIGPYPRDADIPRQVSVELDPHDTWNLDHTLALIIAPALRRFRDMTHSFPGDFHRDDDLEGEAGMAAWQAALDKMIAAFESVAIGYDVTDPANADSHTAREAALQEGLALFARYYSDLWD